MNICEAIQARGENDPYIARRSWNSGVVRSDPSMFCIMPTDSPDGCIFYGDGKPMPRWQPTKEDLTADDWVTVDFWHVPDRTKSRRM